MNIVLIGYRGTGKTTVAQILGKRLSRPVLNMDRLIAERAGMSIPEIVEKSGWERFRELESEIARELSMKDGLVIDAGGGVILRPENIENLKRNAKLVLLTASVGTIVRRIGGDAGRPSLTGKKSFTEEVEDVLRERRSRYEEASDFTVDTDGLPPGEVADMVLAALAL